VIVEKPCDPVVLDSRVGMEVTRDVDASYLTECGGARRACHGQTPPRNRRNARPHALQRRYPDEPVEWRGASQKLSFFFCTIRYPFGYSTASSTCSQSQGKRRVSLYHRVRRGRQHMRSKRLTSTTMLAPNILPGSASGNRHESSMHRGSQRRRPDRRRSSCADR